MKVWPYQYYLVEFVVKLDEHMNCLNFIKIIMIYLENRILFLFFPSYISILVFGIYFLLLIDA